MTICCGGVTAGGVVSRTMTSNVAVAVLPAASVAEQVTGVVVGALPVKPKVLPDVGEQTTGTSRSTSSVAVTANVTTAPVGLCASARIGTGLGSVITGGVVSEVPLRGPTRRTWNESVMSRSPFGSTSRFHAAPKIDDSAWPSPSEYGSSSELLMFGSKMWNPATVEMGIVAYAGVPIRVEPDETIGSFCAVDMKPRRWDTRELRALDADLESALSRQLDRATTLHIQDVRTQIARALDPTVQGAALGARTSTDLSEDALFDVTLAADQCWPDYAVTPRGQQ